MKQVPEFKFKGEPLSEEYSKNFLKLLMAKKNERPLAESKLAKDFLAQIFLKRIEGYELKFTVTDFFFAFSATIAFNNPGKVMILLRLCYQYWRDESETLIGIEYFAQIFPWGAPTDGELKEMWYSQKYNDRPSDSLNDNLLDYPELWIPAVEDVKRLKEKKRKIE